MWKRIILAILLFFPSAEAECLPITVNFHVLTPIYPVELKEAKLAGTYRDGSEEPIYEQVFFPRSMVKIKGDLSVPYYQPLDSSPHDGEGNIIKSDSVFVEANFEGQKLYCTSIAQKKRNVLLANMDLGVCLSDPDGSGTFTQMICFASAAHLLPEWHAYDVKHLTTGIGMSKSPIRASVHVDYEAISVDNYASRIVIHASHSGFGGYRWAPVLDISPELRRDGPGSAQNQYFDAIAVAKFPENGVYSYQWSQSYGPQVGKPLSFGTAISVNFEKQNDGLWKLDYSKTLAPGLYAMHFVSGEGYGLFGFDLWP